MEEAANASYVVILDKGSIVAEGTPYELKTGMCRTRFLFMVYLKHKLSLYIMIIRKYVMVTG